MSVDTLDKLVLTEFVHVSEVYMMFEWVLTIASVAWTPALHAQVKRKKKEEAANAKIMEADKRNKVSNMILKKKLGFFLTLFASIPTE